MKSLIKDQAERFVRKKKIFKRWLAAVLCLALIVTMGTFAALTQNGRALDHTHTEECYDADGNLICSEAELEGESADADAAAGYSEAKGGTDAAAGTAIADGTDVADGTAIADGADAADGTNAADGTDAAGETAIADGADAADGTTIADGADAADKTGAADGTDETDGVQAADGKEASGADGTGDAANAQAENPDAAESGDADAAEDAANGEAYDVAAALSYEDDEITVNVSAQTEDAIPAGATLRVTPILKDAEETEAQYAEVEEQLLAKAAEEEYEIAGFLAYDITLLDKDGNEIEPDGDVKVSFDYKEAAIPEGAADVISGALENTAGSAATYEESADSAVAAADITVLHLEEDEQGEVTDIVDLGAEDDNKIETLETTENQEVEKVEFVTDGFSVYTVTWKTSSYSQNSYTIYVHYVNENGIDINGKSGAAEETVGSDWITIGDKFKRDISGYTYQSAHINSYGGAAAIQIKCEQGQIKYRNNNNGDGNTWKTEAADVNGEETTGYHLYLVYKMAGDIIIDDSEFNETGNLTAVVSSEIQQTIDEAEQAGKTVTYVWYKSTDGGTTYTEVEAKKTSGENYNITNGGKTLNVVYDEGWLTEKQTSVSYKVALVIGEEKQVESAPYDIKYYNELQNGSFEIPVAPESEDKAKERNWAWRNQTSNDIYATEKGVWQTTAPGGTETGALSDTSRDIEVINTKYDTDMIGGYSWNGTFEAKDKQQFVELNCAAAGALYQDVMTIPGEKMSWYLSHRARGKNQYGTNEYDTMYLVIAPLDVVEDVTTEDALKKFLKESCEVNIADTSANSNAAIQGKDTDELEYENEENGIYVYRVTSSDQAWNYVYQAEAYTSTDAVTRFFFVAGATASGSTTVGNFLDYVGFSQKLPPAAPDKFNLQITKKIEGLTEDEIATLREQLNFEITVTDQSDTAVNGMSFGDGDATTDENGKLTLSVENDSEMISYNNNLLTVTFTNVQMPANDSVKISVEEKGYELDGFIVETSTEIDALYGAIKNDNGIVTVKGQSTAVFKFTNTYVSNATKNINFKKIWDDNNNSEDTRPDSITVTLVGKVGENVVRSYGPVTVTEKMGWAYTWPDVPIRSNGETIVWTVEETLGDTSYVYESLGVFTSEEDAYAEVEDEGGWYEGCGNPLQINYLTVEDWEKGSTAQTETTETVNSSDEDTGTSTEASVAEGGEETEGTSGTTKQTALSKLVSYVAALNPLSTYTVNAANDWGNGNSSSESSSSSTFNHIDIEADGSYTFTYKGEEYTLTYDFYDKTWTVKTVDGDPVSSGTLKMSDFTITNVTGGDSVQVTGSWQSSTSSSHEYEYRISGTFDRSDTFQIHFEIPVVMEDGVKINLVADFQTDYADTTYNVCPGEGNGRGIDIEMNRALNQVLSNGVLVINKTFAGIEEGDIPAGLEFIVYDSSNQEVARISWSDFEDGSYTTSSIDSGTYTIVESGGELTGYQWTVTSDVSDADGTETYEGDNPEVNITEGVVSTVSFTNTYAENESEQTFTFKKVWSDNSNEKEKRPQTVTLNVEYSNGQKSDVTLQADENGTDTWTATNTLTATSNVTIKYVDEKAVDGYNTPEVVYSTDGKSAIVYNAIADTTENKTITIQKVWEDNDNEADLRPETITVRVYQTTTSGGEKEEKVFAGGIDLSEDNNWSAQVSVPVGNGYEYHVTEVTNESSGYYNMEEVVDSQTGDITLTNSLIDGAADESFYIVNKLQTEDLTVTKIWDDNGSGRPDYVDLTLAAGNTGSTRTVRLNNQQIEGNGDIYNVWTLKVSDLPKLSSGAGAYTIVGESLSSGYTAVANEGASDSSDADYSYIIDGTGLVITNTQLKVNIPFQKIWDDGNDVFGKRPESVTFQLYQREVGSKDNFTLVAEDNATVKLTGDNADEDYEYIWYGSFDDLSTSYEYQIKEVNNAESGSDLSGYTPSNDDYILTLDGNGVLSITNSLTGGWKMVKRSANSTTDGDNKEIFNVLSGAEFTLTKTTGNGSTASTDAIYYGKSDTDGVIVWYTDSGFGTEQNLLGILDGTYILKETKAPAGYQLSTTKWSLVIKNGYPVLETGGDGKYVGLTDGMVVDASNATIYITNDVLYSLPEAGGPGIYIYTIAGILLMMAGAFVLYKRRGGAAI